MRSSAPMAAAQRRDVQMDWKFENGPNADGDVHLRVPLDLVRVLSGLRPHMPDSQFPRPTRTFADLPERLVDAADGQGRMTGRNAYLPEAAVKELRTAMRMAGMMPDLRLDVRPAGEIQALPLDANAIRHGLVGAELTVSHPDNPQRLVAAHITDVRQFPNLEGDYLEISLRDTPHKSFVRVDLANTIAHEFSGPEVRSDLGASIETKPAAAIAPAGPAGALPAAESDEPDAGAFRL